MTDEIRIPNIDALLQLAVKLRAIILYLLENCMLNSKEQIIYLLLLFIAAFDDFEGTLKRLHTLKCLVNQYQSLFTPNVNILVTVRILPLSYLSYFLTFFFLLKIESQSSSSSNRNY